MVGRRQISPIECCPGDDALYRPERRQVSNSYGEVPDIVGAAKEILATSRACGNSIAKVRICPVS